MAWTIERPFWTVERGPFKGKRLSPFSGEIWYDNGNPNTIPVCTVTGPWAWLEEILTQVDDKPVMEEWDPVSGLITK